MARLEAEQEAERRVAMAAAEARRAELAEAAESARRMAAAQREAEEEAAAKAAKARREESEALRAEIENVVGEREVLRAKLRALGEALAASEEECSKLRHQLADWKVMAAEGEERRREDVEREAARAAMEAQRAEHAEEKLKLVNAQACRLAGGRWREEVETVTGGNVRWRMGEEVERGKVGKERWKWWVEGLRSGMVGGRGGLGF